MEPINLAAKFDRFTEQWSPRVVAALNGQLVKLARVQGTFVWHAHEAEDELFLVVEGRLGIEFRDRTVELGPGELLVVPRGVEHRPFARDEAKVLLFEPAATRHAGSTITPRAVDQQPWI